MSGLPCPNCGSELSFLEQYQRHYCYACGRYAPEGYGDRGAKTCPTCGGVLSYVAQYERYFCYRCNTYPPMEGPAEGKEPQAETVTISEPAAPPAKPEEVIEAPVKSEPEEAKPEPVETPSTPSAPSEEPAEEEIPQETTTPVPKPPLVRKVIWQGKKPVLMDLCKAYGLDPSGTKEQLRDRLLSYLDELEPEPRPTEVEVAAEETPTERAEAEVPAEAPRSDQPGEPVIEAVVPEEIPRHEPTPTEPSGPTTAALPQVVLEPAPAPSVAQPESVVMVPEVPVVREAPRVEHPCPTCGRELTYIAQYNRWYCYSCRAYAPWARSKNACPNCGATLRWIERYERWWCDACRRYAPADLPRPERAVTVVQGAVVAVETPVARVALQPAIAVAHRHRSPGNGIGLMVLGLALFVLYEVLVDLPAVAASFNPGIALAPNVAWGMRFFAFVFVAFGAMVALVAVRDRR